MSSKNVIALFGLYIIIGLTLFFIESRFEQTSIQTIGIGIACIATVFLIFTLGEIILTKYVRKKNQSYLSSVIIGTKSVRLLFTLLAVAVYGMLKVPELIPFCINIFTFYIVTLIYTTAFNLLKNKP